MGVHQVVVLALPEAVGFELGIAPRLFGASDAVDANGEPLYRVRVCSLDSGPVRTTAGYSVLPDHGPEVLAEADTLLVTGHHDSRALVDGTLEPELAQALAAVPGNARRVSICTGAFVLAAAGLLDGRPATTHWQWIDRFRALYPNVLLNPDVLFVDDGDVLTSAGNAAGFDLCLHLLRRDHGSALANRVAKGAVLPPWREGGQSQFIQRPLPDPADTTTGPTRALALRRLNEPLDLATLAEHARMSVRTFTRRFREETGLSPSRWLTAQRVERARQLLENTDLPVDRIAADCGFGSAVSLRQHLHAALGVAPLAYRRTFRRAS